MKKFIPIFIGAVWLGLAFFFLIHADYAKTAKAATIQEWIAGGLFVSFALLCVVGYFTGAFNKKK